jgi:hypothetical protein
LFLLLTRTRRPGSLVLRDAEIDTN